MALRCLRNAARGLDLVGVQTYRDSFIRTLVRWLLGVEADEAAGRAMAALSRVEGDTLGLRELAYFVRHRES